jgi:hypothetical protein
MRFTIDDKSPHLGRMRQQRRPMILSVPNAKASIRDDPSVSLSPGSLMNPRDFRSVITGGQTDNAIHVTSVEADTLPVLIQRCGRLFMSRSAKIELELDRFDQLDTEGFADVSAGNSAIAAVGPGPGPGSSAIAAVGPGPGGRRTARKVDGSAVPLVSWSEVAVSNRE